MKRNSHFLKLFIRQSLPLVFGILLVGISASFITRSFLRKNSIRSANVSLSQAIRYYDTILDGMDALSLEFSANTDVLTRLRAITESENVPYNEYRESRILEAFVNSSSNSHRYIKDIFIYTDNPTGIILSSSQGFSDVHMLPDSTWFTTYFDTIHPQNNSAEPWEADDIIRISRPVSNSQGTQTGVIVLDLKASALASAAPSDGLLTVRNEKGQPLFTGGYGYEAYPPSKMEDFTAVSPKYGWSYTLSYPKPVLYRLSVSFLWYTLALTLSALVLSLFLARKANAKERKFLNTVMKELNQTQEADDTLDSYSNVFDYLDYHILKVFIEEDYLRWQKEAMEYRALQMQINPHFLFNTLDTINWQAIKLTGGENDASHMILLLSKLLQYALRVEGLEGVKLGQELEQMHNYIDLQQYRFHDNFAFSQTIDPTLLEAQVPCMLLQPLLENVFNHGFIAGKKLSIFLEIIPEEDGKFHIIIKNDGNPIPNDELVHLNADDDDVLKKKQSLGFANTRKRLLLFFKGNAAMTVDSDGINGSEVRILLPIKG